MRNRRRADKSNVVIKIIKHGGPVLHQKMLDYYNDIFLTSAIPENWHIIIFTMFPKNGDLTKVGN